MHLSMVSFCDLACLFQHHVSSKVPIDQSTDHCNIRINLLKTALIIKHPKSESIRIHFVKNVTTFAYWNKKNILSWYTKKYDFSTGMKCFGITHIVNAPLINGFKWPIDLEIYFVIFILKSQFKTESLNWRNFLHVPGNLDLQ